MPRLANERGFFYTFTGMPPALQLYIHVPFCEKKCHYCDFASWELPAVQQRRWAEVILREISLRAPLAKGRPVDTIFFGGGTPSLLAMEFMNTIVAALRSQFDLSLLREMSIECNPSSLTREKLDLYHGLGFNRLSLGIQSFHAEELTRLGRVHTVETAKLALQTVREDGRFQFSGDLIFGVPGQTQESFLSSLETLLRFDPDHVSFYGLTIEDGTEFAKQQALGTLVLPDDGIYNEMYLAGVDLLAGRGYHRYEVSNFSKPEKPSLHNQGYWNGAEYLAFGPGAHAYFHGRRMVSPRSFTGYLDWGAADFPDDAWGIEVLESDQKSTEALMLGLRQARGADKIQLAGLGFELSSSALDKWVKAGMLVVEGNTLRLVGDGWLFLDEISSDLLARGKSSR